MKLGQFHLDHGKHMVDATARTAAAEYIFGLPGQMQRMYSAECAFKALNAGLLSECVAHIPASCQIVL